MHNVRMRIVGETLPVIANRKAKISLRTCFAPALATTLSTFSFPLPGWRVILLGGCGLAFRGAQGQRANRQISVYTEG
jgi:hypothetical protein